jgi:hypothetical protein
MYVGQHIYEFSLTCKLCQIGFVVSLQSLFVVSVHPHELGITTAAGECKTLMYTAIPTQLRTAAAHIIPGNCLVILGRLPLFKSSSTRILGSSQSECAFWKFCSGFQGVLLLRIVHLLFSHGLQASRVSRVQFHDTPLYIFSRYV